MNEMVRFISLGTIFHSNSNNEYKSVFFEKFYD